MAAEWRELRIGDLVRQGALSVSDGYRVRNDELGPEGIPFVRGGDIGDGWINTDTEDHIRPEFVHRVQAKLTQPGDAAFITKGTVGRAGRLRSNQPSVVLAPQVAYWRVLDQSVLDAGFVFYLLRSAQFQSALDGVKTHGSMAADYVSISQQHDFSFRFPAVREQRAIARILGALDDKIELNRRMNETLEAMARALFKSWFVDFDPVHAKAEARFLGLAEPLASLFPDCFEDSGSGPFPKGWAISTLGQVAEHPRRGIQPGAIRPSTPYIGLEHMPRECIALSEWGDADGVGSNKFGFRRGEILFGKLRPYFHKVGIAPIDGVCSTDIVVVRPTVSDWLGFVLGHVSSRKFVEHTNAGSTGTRMPRTNWEAMRRYEVVLPPQALAKAFSELVQPMLDRIIAGILESRTLGALRDALLPRLISGELRAADAEKVMGAVA